MTLTITRIGRKRTIRHKGKSYSRGQEEALDKVLSNSEKRELSDAGNVVVTETDVQSENAPDNRKPTSRRKSRS